MVDELTHCNQGVSFAEVVSKDKHAKAEKVIRHLWVVLYRVTFTESH
jgi:hypothetical protein